MRILYLLAAVLMMSGCATSRIQYVPRIVPPLDGRLAEPCAPIPDLPVDPKDYDEWQSALWSVRGAASRDDCLLA